MKNIDLGQTISILANLGVIAGIVFHGLELQQNNDLLTAQAAYNQFSIERETRRPFIENTEGFAEMFAKLNDGQPITRVESVRLTNLIIDVIDSWRYQFREVRAGRLPEEFIDLDKWRFWWNRGIGVPERFELDRLTSDPDFVRFVYENVDNG